MEEKKYILTETELFNLLIDQLQLQYLESNGVDNWEWYGEGRNLFIAECLDISEEEVSVKNFDMEDVAMKVIKFYKEVQ